MNQFKLSAFIAGLFTASFALSERIEIPLGQQGQKSAYEQPRRGMDKFQVEKRFGTPISKRGPRGTPPIFTWEYPHYTVYFESSHVLHTVKKHHP